MFQNREEAGRLLGEKLKEKYGKDVVVLGIPRGGVVVAKVVAAILGAPLDMVVVRKIGAPDNPELAIGAVGPGGVVYWDDRLCRQLSINKSAKLKVKSEKLLEQKEREKRLREGKNLTSLQDKIVLLIDDGVATGATVLAAALFLKKQKVKEAILATPVIAKDTLEKVKKYFSEVIFLDAPGQFYAVGQFYREFPQASDDEVIKLLEDRA